MSSPNNEIIKTPATQSHSERKTLRSLERLRIKVLLVRILTVAIITLAAVAYIAVCAYVIWQDGETTREIRFIMVACGAIVLTAVVPLGMFAGSMLRHYAQRYKDTLVRGVLAEVFPDGCDYRPDSGFTSEEINALPLFKAANDISSEDYISSVYDGVRFRQADVVAACLIVRTLTVLFDGRLFEFDLPGIPEARLLVCSRRFPYKDRPADYGLYDVELPADYGARYIASSDRPEAAAELLPRNIFERIDSVAGCFDGIALYICGGSLYLAGRTFSSSAFEPTIRKKLDLDKEKARIRSELEVIERLIEAIKPDDSSDVTAEPFIPSDNDELPKREPIRP